MFALAAEGGAHFVGGRHGDNRRHCPDGHSRTGCSHATTTGRLTATRPFSVRLRISEPEAQRLHVSIAAEKDSKDQGQRDAAQFIDRRVLRRRPRARTEHVTGRTGQINCRGECPRGLDVRPPSFPALERADSMDRQAGNRRELLLREACGFRVP